MKLKTGVVLLVAVMFLMGCSQMNRRANCFLTGAAVGAAVGSGAGVAIGNGGSTDNKAGGGLVGAVAGAVVGGTIGYLICKEEPKPEPIVVPEPPPPPPPKPEPKPEPVVEEPKVIERIIISAIRFDFDKAVIRPEFYPLLDEGIERLKKHPERKVEIEGHTCSIGPAEYNMGLSIRRAQSVKDYLVEKGISADRLSIKGYGLTKPAADNKTLEGRRINRRVEFNVLNGK